MFVILDQCDKNVRQSWLFMEGALTGVYHTVAVEQFCVYFGCYQGPQVELDHQGFMDFSGDSCMKILS